MTASASRGFQAIVSGVASDRSAIGSIASFTAGKCPRRRNVVWARCCDSCVCSVASVASALVSVASVELRSRTQKETHRFSPNRRVLPLTSRRQHLSPLVLSARPRTTDATPVASWCPQGWTATPPPPRRSNLFSSRCIARPPPAGMCSRFADRRPAFAAGRSRQRVPRPSHRLRNTHEVVADPTPQGSATDPRPNRDAAAA